MFTYREPIFASETKLCSGTKNITIVYNIQLIKLYESLYFLISHEVWSYSNKLSSLYLWSESKSWTFISHHIFFSFKNFESLAFLYGFVNDFGIGSQPSQGRQYFSIIMTGDIESGYKTIRLHTHSLNFFSFFL